MKKNLIFSVGLIALAFAIGAYQLRSAPWQLMVFGGLFGLYWLIARNEWLQSKPEGHWLWKIPGLRPTAILLREMLSVPIAYRMGIIVIFFIVIKTTLWCFA
jgi:hypothetical protein